MKSVRFLRPVTDIIWKDRYVEKLVDKYGVTVPEAEDVLLSRPVVRKVATWHGVADLGA